VARADCGAVNCRVESHRRNLVPCLLPRFQSTPILLAFAISSLPLIVNTETGPRGIPMIFEGGVHAQNTLHSLMHVPRLNIVTCKQLASTSGQQHELLHSQFVSCVASSIDHVECWNWKYELRIAGKVSNMFVQRNTLITPTPSQLTHFNNQYHFRDDLCQSDMQHL